MSDRWGRDRVAEIQRNETPGSPVELVEPAAPEVQALVEAGPESTVREAEPDKEGGTWLDSLIILAVAAVAAAASYGHMLEVAVTGGEPLWLARAFPITVDGLVVAALRRGRDGRWWLALGVAVSVAANMLSRYPELAEAAGPVISAWPPIALFGTHRLLRGRSQR
jgi:hypothetical protein